MVANRVIGTILSPWPPNTIQLTSCAESPVSIAKNARNLPESRAPAMPTTLLLSKPETLWKAYTMASKGFDITITNAFGAYFLTLEATSFIMPRLIDIKSSLSIPGFLGIPAVIITTSEPLMSL